MPHGGAGALLPVHCVRIRIWHRRAALKRDFILTSVLIAAMIAFVTIPLFGHLSDRLGRKRVYMFGAALTGLYGFAYFALLDTRVPALVGACHRAFARAARHHVRPPGSINRRIVHRAPPLQRRVARLSTLVSDRRRARPADCVSLLSHYHSATPIAIFILGCAITSLIATSMLTDRTDQDISGD